MKNWVTKNHAGCPDKTLHFLLVKGTLDKFVTQTTISGGEQMTLYDKQWGEADGNATTGIKLRLGTIVSSVNSVEFQGQDSGWVDVMEMVDKTYRREGVTIYIYDVSSRSRSHGDYLHNVKRGCLKCPAREHNISISYCRTPRSE